MHLIIFTNEDGLCLSKFFPKEAIERDLGKSMTQEEYETHCINSIKPQNPINPRWINEEDLPPENEKFEFFGAWEDDGKKVSINYLKARDIRLKKLRLQRNQILKNKYDALANRARDMGLDNELRDILIKKQVLRDCTENLKNIKPTCLQDILDNTPSLEEF